MNGLIVKDRSIFKSSLALLGAGVFALFALSGCGSGGGGGLSGDDQKPDPGTVEYPIAYIQRPIPEEPVQQNDEDDLQNPFAFNPGAKLLVRSRADSNAEEINVTDSLVAADEKELYDVKDLAVSPDGKNLVFAFHKAMLENVDPIDQPSWDIYIYNFATRQVRQVIPNKNKSEGSDVAPHFLADGRIVFVSDRQQKTREQLTNMGSPAYSGLVEDGPVKAGVLHLMNADGSGIEQISFNQSHELSPAQLRNGKLVFIRWDNMSGSSQRNMNIYSLNPTGMNLSYMYGYRSHNTGSNNETVQFSMPREMEDGRIVTILRQQQTANRGGDLVAIDVAHFSDNNQPTWENAGRVGPAQQSLATNPVSTDDRILSAGGQFGAVWPLFDGTGRLLISWSQCRYLDDNDVIRACTSSTPPDAEPAPLLYGLWIFDPKAQTQKPIVTPKEGVIYSDIVAASPTKTIAETKDNTPANNSTDLTDYGNNISSVLATNNTAVLDIRSVYNFDNGIGNYGFAAPANMIASQVIPSSDLNSTYQTRKARFLQIVQGVAKPDPNDEIPAGPDEILRVPGFAANYLRHIVGYVPIEADGSVVVQVPADVPITFNVLDENAQRLNGGGTHQVWMQFRAGEVVRCTGCHSTSNTNATLTHGRADSSAPDSNPGTTGTGFFAGVSVGSLNFAGSRVGQSMAEAYAANKQKPRLPSLNAYFTDEWATNAGQRNATLDYRYKTLDSSRPQRVPKVPVTSESCLEDAASPLVARWSSSCRIVINYLEHIQPIWSVQSRMINTVDGSTFPSDRKCTNCHAPTNAMGVAQVPAGQLDLTGGASDRDNNRVMSRSELFDGDNVKDIAGNPVPLLDSNNQPVLDADGNPEFQRVAAVMSASGAFDSSRFFNCFNGGLCGRSLADGVARTQSHAGMLTKGELRLLSEWLDNGAQYYNDVAKAAAAQ